MTSENHDDQSAEDTTSRGPYTLVGGWTRLTENGDAHDAVHIVLNSDTAELSPIRADEIASDLKHTRAALDAMRAE